MRYRTARLARAIGLGVLLAPFLGALPSPDAAANQAPWTAKVDQVFADWNRSDSPGCAVALFKDGRIVYERGYGTADLEHDAPITPETVFYVGSLSKQFTAMAAALAIRRGRFGLDDDIRKYLPELPDYGTPITVRHLIHHTSGLRDVNTLLAIAGRRDEDAFDNLAVLRIVARQKALNFTPGTEYLYSNSGYAMLALIVERTTGTPFAEFADTNIFSPLGMAVTHFHTDVSRIVKNRAFAYRRSPGGVMRLDTPQNERAGAGGLFTTVHELLAWDENFYTGRVGGRDLIRELETPGRTSDGKPLDYGWGLTIGTYRGAPIVDHGGALGGYRADLIRFRDQHFSVACLCNLGSIDPGALVRRVADAYLSDVLREPEAPRASPPAAAGVRASKGPVALSAGELAAFTGRYYSEELDTTYELFAEDAALKVRRGVQRGAVRLDPLGADLFGLPGITLRFVHAKDGRADAFVIDAGRVRGIRFARQPVSPGQLQRLR